MTCPGLRARFDDYVAGRLSDIEARALEAHLEGCAECEAFLESQAWPIDAVRSLPRAVAPREDLWPAIGSRLSPRESAHRRRVAVPRWALAAAAVLLVAVSSGVTAVLIRRSAVPSVVQPSGSLEAQYAAASEELTAALEKARARLAPETFASIQRSLGIIDAALDESRRALARDPVNEGLQLLVAAAWRQKVDLLRRATGLGAES